MSSAFDPSGHAWLQLGELTLAFVLSALVGVEREIRHKSAGLRTHTVVGVAAALIMLISKYGFMDVLASGRVVVDPSRIAAQVVSGIGFIGGGVIFMRRDVVRGLTTAASVWLTAALGMACGAGLPALAVATTAGHFIIMLVFPALERRLPGSRQGVAHVHVGYQHSRELLRAILLKCGELQFAIDHVRLERGNASGISEEALDLADSEGTEEAGPQIWSGAMNLSMRVRGTQPVSDLIAALGALDGVHEVGITSGETDQD